MSRPWGSINFAKRARDIHHHRKRQDAALKADLQAEGLIEAPRLRFVAGEIFCGGICQPSPKLDQDERAAVAAWLEQKAPRRFLPGDSADDFNLCVFLIGKGYRVQRNCSLGSRRAPYFIDEKAYTRAGFLAFINAVRAQFQMQPVGLPA